MMGRIAKDIATHTPGVNRQLLAKSSIAVNTRIKSPAGEERVETCFLEFEAWGDLARALYNGFEKGDPIVLIGRLKQYQYEDKRTSTTATKHVLRVESFQNIKGAANEPNNGDTAPESLFQIPSETEEEGEG
jgi:single-strand DNA-binding protein